MSLDIAPFNLLQVLEDVVMLVSPKAMGKGVEVILTYDPALPVMLDGDASRIRQLLINLIGNAVKFTLEGEVRARVTGTAADGAATLSIAIEDTGIGIPDDAVDGIFGEFIQVDQTRARKFEGTGLGLAITKRLVDMMAGEIDVSSVLEEGTVFTISLTLPVAETDAMSEMAIIPGMARVLCVDDSATNREVLAQWLGRAGMTVIASDGGSGLPDQLAEAPPDLVLIDAQLPPEVSRHVLTAVSSAAPRAPIIALATTEPPETVTLPQDAVAGRILKPLRPTLLVRQIMEIIGSTEATGNAGTQGNQGTTDAPPDPEILARDQPLNILVAEDNRTNQLVMKKMLKGQPVTLTFADNGAIAVDTFQTLRPDLMFMDISMPEMDGFEATEAIRDFELQQQLSRTPIVALTANALTEDRDRCLARGMDDYLSKPVRKGALLEVIERICPADMSDERSKMRGAG
ncbi:MAG: response regulator [Pseudomonadota bacterium]